MSGKTWVPEVLKRVVAKVRAMKCTSNAGTVARCAIEQYRSEKTVFNFIRRAMRNSIAIAFRDYWETRDLVHQAKTWRAFFARLSRSMCVRSTLQEIKPAEAAEKL